MKYTITIQQEREETRLTGREWQVLKQDADGKPERGYTPQVEERRIVKVTVLEQTVDELDIVAVIKAINGIE